MENDNTDKFLDAQFSSVYWISSIFFDNLGEQSSEFQASLINIDKEEDNKPMLDSSKSKWLKKS